MRTSEPTSVKAMHGKGGIPHARQESRSAASGPTGAVAPLEATAFAAVVASAPLISIDLLVKDGRGRVLFGRRRNPPAKGYLFVPGGRIYKNETLASAFSRIAHDELGLNIDRNDSHLSGVYEHFYDIDFMGRNEVGTHYIVLAHSIPMQSDSFWLPLRQHSDYEWVNEEAIPRHPDIHDYAKAYFH